MTDRLLFSRLHHGGDLRNHSLAQENSPLDTTEFNEIRRRALESIDKVKGAQVALMPWCGAASRKIIAENHI